jgi:hypothetical protein
MFLLEILVIVFIELDFCFAMVGFGHVVLDKKIVYAELFIGFLVDCVYSG